MVEFERDTTLLHQLLLIDGVGRSGKVMLAEIMTGFNRVEKEEYNEFLEYIALAYKYEKISKDMAITILKTQMDVALYSNMIGRSVNSRPTDYTSIYKYHSPELYIKRATEQDGPIIGDIVKKDKPIYLNWCHDMIQKSDIIFEAFQEKVKLIYINRRPIDIIYEWDKKNFGERIASDPTDRQYTIKYKDTYVPEVSVGWEEEYLSMQPLERIVKIIHTSFTRNLKAIKSKNINNQVMILNFEDLVTIPEICVKHIQIFLDTKPLPVLKNILTRENCPRVLDNKEFETRRHNVESKISNEYKHYIVELEQMYLEISKYTLS